MARSKSTMKGRVGERRNRSRSGNGKPRRSADSSESRPSERRRTRQASSPSPPARINRSNKEVEQAKHRVLDEAHVNLEGCPAPIRDVEYLAEASSRGTVGIVSATTPSSDNPTVLTKPKRYRGMARKKRVHKTRLQGVHAEMRSSSGSKIDSRFPVSGDLDKFMKHHKERIDHSDDDSSQSSVTVVADASLFRKVLDELLSSASHEPARQYHTCTRVVYDSDTGKVVTDLTKHKNLKWKAIVKEVDDEEAAPAPAAVRAARAGKISKGYQEKESHNFGMEHQVKGVHYTMKDTTGEVEYQGEQWMVRQRRKIADLIIPSPRETPKATAAQKLTRGLRKRLARRIEPKQSVVPVAVAEAILNGRVQATDSASGGGDAPHVEFTTAHRARVTNLPHKIPTRAGDIVAILRGIHGPLPETPENRTLIFQDASRRARALKLNEDIRFRDMRDVDLADAILWAGELFFYKWDSVESAAILREDPNAKKSVRAQNEYAKRFCAPSSN